MFCAHPFPKSQLLIINVPLKGVGKTLIFFSLLFWKKARKTTKKASIFDPCQTPKTLGKEGKNAQESKDFLEKGKTQGYPQKQGKEDQGRGRPLTLFVGHFLVTFCLRSLLGSLCFVFGCHFAYPLLPTPFCGTLILVTVCALLGSLFFAIMIQLPLRTINCYHLQLNPTKRY